MQLVGSQTHPALWARLIIASLLASVLGCQPDPGGVTAQLVFPQNQGLPVEIARLEIQALDANDEVLAAISLSENPGEGELLLERDGGTWSLDAVPIGDDRKIRALAYFGTTNDPATDGQLAMRGEQGSVRVRSGEVTDVGAIPLAVEPGVRVPSLDVDSPGAPGQLLVAPHPMGAALSATFQMPSEDDTAGYFIVVTSSAATPPAFDRGEVQPEVGFEVGPGLVIRAVGPAAASETATVTIAGLSNGVGYTLFVYAYDDDFSGAALNVSGAASGFGTPADTQPPGQVQNLSISARTATVATIDFIGTGDNDDAGTPERYELRASRDQASLIDPTAFEQLPVVAPPPTAPSGTPITVDRGFLELGMTPDERFFIGVRAVDAANNVGFVQTAEYVGSATISPSIQSVQPEIALTGSNVTLRGAQFGAAAGTVILQSWTSSLTWSLPIFSWTDVLVEVNVPPAAESGTLYLNRPSGETALTELVVVVRQPDVASNAAPPVALLTSPVSGGNAASAHYFEQDVGMFEQKVERYFAFGITDTVAQTTSANTMTAVAGAYSEPHDQFVFIASTTEPSTMNGVVLSTTTPPVELLLPIAALAGNADSIALELLEPPILDGRLPALLAFSTAGLVRTATVVDIRRDRFQRFVVVNTASQAGDLVRLGRRSLPATPNLSPILMAYREAGTTDDIIRVLDATGTGGGIGDFRPRSRLGAPRVDDRIEIVDVPGAGFFIVYEEPVANGTEVRILAASDYGSGPGFAPLPSVGAPRHLEDVGLIIRNSKIWIALLTSTQPADEKELNYVEINPASVTASGRGTATGVRLDVAEDAHGVMGCKLPTATCPILWTNAQYSEPRVLFVRR